MIRITHKGDYSKVTRYFEKLIKRATIVALEKYGQMAVDALAAATPVRSGLTASSWHFEINKTGKGYSIDLYNSHVNKGVPIAIILQYGHGTGTGGWVEGRDYINPAIQPVFDKLASDAWKEVSNG